MQIGASHEAFRARVCLISEDLALPLDEGLKKFCYSIAGRLRERVDLMMVSTAPCGPLPGSVEHLPANRLMGGSRLRHAIRSFRPDAIVYVPRAAGTRNAFIRAARLRRHAPAAATLLLSLQPRRYGVLARSIIRRLHPDVTGAQSLYVRDQLRRIGVPAIEIPSGVDTEAFRPVVHTDKARLRFKYGIPSDAFVVLHVGHLRRERNVLFLDRVRRELGCEVVMVASTSTEARLDVSDVLRHGGVRIVDSYIENIAELYQLSDAYLFPVHVPYGAIEMPLSVLEAMACGVSVVSTPFGALPAWLPAGPGLAYARDDDSLLEALRRLRAAKPGEPPDLIRQRTESFSWPAVADRILSSLGLDTVPEGVEAWRTDLRRVDSLDPGRASAIGQS